MRIFTAVKQAILNDSFLTLEKIVFICTDTDLSLTKLRTCFEDGL